MGSYQFIAQRPIEKYHKVDLGFLVATLLLWGLGLFTVFTCSQNYAVRFFNGDAFYFVKRQLICSVAGLALFLFFLFLDMKRMKNLVVYMVIFTIILCLCTFIKPLSIEINGARRWIRLPFNFSFQPSELVKFTIILYLAEYFSKLLEVEKSERTVLPCVGIFLTFVLLVFFQKDFSTSVFIFFIGLVVFFIANAKLIWLIPFSFIAIPSVVLAIATEDYRINRIRGFFHPEEGSTTFNFQTLASKNAISEGGIWGKGIGVGLSKLNKIPEVQADYIFAGWAEAMGFVGVLIYFLLLGFFAWRGYRAACKAKTAFSSYACFGCVSVILLQSIMNCMVVCGLLPSTGIPLPFFSVGGSSIMVTLAMCGFILNVSRNEEKEENYIKFEEVNIDTLTVL